MTSDLHRRLNSARWYLPERECRNHNYMRSPVVLRVIAATVESFLRNRHRQRFSRTISSTDFSVSPSRADRPKDVIESRL